MSGSDNGTPGCLDSVWGIFFGPAPDPEADNDDQGNQIDAPEKTPAQKSTEVKEKASPSSKEPTPGQAANEDEKKVSKPSEEPKESMEDAKK